MKRPRPSQADPLDLPPFLRLSAEARRAAWERNPPRAAPAYVPRPTSTLLERAIDDARLRSSFNVQGTVTGRLPPVPKVEEVEKVAPVKQPADDLGARISDYLAKGDFKTRLIALAGVNDVWNPEYSKLDKGRMRMTVSNRLRGLVKKGLEIWWPK